MTNLPAEHAKWRANNPDERRSHAGMPNMNTDTHGIAEHANMARNTQKRQYTPIRPKPARTCGTDWRPMEAC